jgi:pimeloyl-ACP methyl ester carboxylesterase
MNKVTSKDGTQIAYDKQGKGPAVILVDGALGHRSLAFGNSLAELLAQHFTVYTYDRRGRGDSGNGKPFTVEREIEDIEALIDVAGGLASLYGISSGACLALEAALKLGRKSSKVALYEPPYNSDKASAPAWKEYRKQLKEFLAADRRGDAVALFMRFVGVPADQIGGMRQMPMWPDMESVAPTLIYDSEAMGGDDRSVPAKHAAKLTVPALVMDGGANFTMMPFMHESATALAKAIPHATHRTLEGQTHDVKAEVLAPVLIEFFAQ